MADEVRVALRRGEDNSGVCVYCRDPLAGEVVTCDDCRVGVHAACRAEMSRCPTLGCGRPWGRVQLWERVELAPVRARNPLVVAYLGLLARPWLRWLTIVALLAGLWWGYGPPARWRADRAAAAATVERFAAALRAKADVEHLLVPGVEVPAVLRILGAASRIRVRPAELEGDTARVFVTTLDMRGDWSGSRWVVLRRVAGEWRIAEGRAFTPSKQGS